MADIGGMIAGVESPNKRAKIDSGPTTTNFDESKFARYYRTDAVSASDSEYTSTATSDASAVAATATYYSFPYSYSNSFSSFTYPYGQSTPSNGSISFTYASPYGYQSYNNVSTQNSFPSADFSSIDSAAIVSGYSATAIQTSSTSSTTTTSPSTCSYQVTSNSPAHHSTPPSCVIHCRAVADGCKETDLITVLQPFGKITYVTLLPKIRQALVEFESLDSAIALVTFAQTNSITVLGRQMFVNYSKSQEIKRDKVLNGDSPNSVSEASNILLLTIINPLHPINVKILHKICITHGKVLRIVIFHKNGLQALVEYETVESAQQALAALNGQDIFAGCCTLKIDYSKKAKKLNVFKNDEETWDYTGTLSTNTTAALPSKTSLLGSGLLSAISATDTPETKVPVASSTNLAMNGKLGGLTNAPIPITNEAIARAAAFPTVQSILAKVASLQSSTSKSPKNDWSVHNDLDELVETIWNPSPLLSHHSASSTGGSSPGETGKKVGLLGTSPFQLSQAGLLSALPGMTHQHSNGLNVTSPTTQPLNTGGTGCVLMVYGLNHEKMNCERIFNLFCLYGNVVKVKFLTNKPGASMVQMSDKVASEMIIRNLSGSVIFDSKINIMFSKHPFIADSSVVTALPDGMPSAMNFADNRNNRFKYLPEGQSLKNRYQPPTRMLHFFNAPPNCTVEQLKEVFLSAGALAPLKGTFFSKANAKSSAGLLEMPDIRSAMEALIITNHYTINPPGGGSYTLKLAFSPSSSISPTAPTVAPAVAAAAAVSTIGGLGPLVMPGSPSSGTLSNGFMHVNGEGEVLGEGMSPEPSTSSP